MTTETTNAAAGPAAPATRWAPFLAIGVATFVTTFDITAVIMIMPQIKAALSLDVSGFAWVMDSYSLAFTVFLASAGVLADRYGRRRALLVGNAAFLVASCVCGLATSEAMLLAGRVLQGVGAAFMVCGGMALVGHRYVERVERAWAFALLGSISGAAMAFGPAGGGMMAQLLGWHWVFFINVPICLFVAVALLRSVAESRDPAQRRVDVRGVLALSAFLVSTVWVLLHGTRLGAATVPLWIVVPAIIAMGMGFVLTQRYGTQPLLELTLFTSGPFIGTCLVPLALSLGYWAVLVYLPLFLQDHLGRPPDESAFLMLAATAPMVLLPLLGARIALALKPGVFFAAGLVVLAAGCTVLALGAQLKSLAIALTGMLVAGAGTAVLHSQVSGAIVALVPREQAGAASAITVILRQGGFALGIAALAGTLQATPSVTVNAYTLLFLVAGASALVSAPLVFLLVTSRGAHRDQTGSDRDALADGTALRCGSCGDRQECHLAAATGDTPRE